MLPKGSIKIISNGKDPRRLFFTEKKCCEVRQQNSNDALVVFVINEIVIL